jgi:hypothetical protein
MKAFRAPAAALAVVVAAGLLLAARGPLYAQGSYAPVDEEAVLAMRLNHYFTPEKKSREADFEWRFFKDGFVIKSGRGPIPADLRDKLIEKGAAAEEISGKWRIERDPHQLTLTDIQVGKKQPRKSKVNFRIYRTAPSVIRVGEPQYVFGVD